MKRLIAFLTLALTAGCADIQMRGIVREEGTGEPLPGATVRVGDKTTTTDLTGYYNLEVDESDDTKQIFVDKAGYVPFSEQVTLSGDDIKEMFQDIELRKREKAQDPDRSPLDQDQYRHQAPQSEPERQPSGGSMEQDLQPGD